MAEQIHVFATSEDLQTHLSDVLATGPLYRELLYDGSRCHESRVNQYGQQHRYGVLPKRISLFCENNDCNKETWWETRDTVVYFEQRFINERKYTCNNCGDDSVSYLFIWQEREDGQSAFVKVGQYPELEERVSDALKTALDKTDLKMYRNALRLRNFGLGLAAVAYMRRVVENRMTDMLEILHEGAIAHNAPKELIARHEEMKKEKRFSERIDYAGDLLPANLRPGGKPNPMAILHELASEGLHAKSDEECVDIFDKCRKTFEYVFGNMRIEIEDAKKYVEGLGGLVEVKTKAASPKTGPSKK